MFTSAILKLTAFCNLNCSYCYMFNLGDKTHSRVPKNMPVPIAIAALDRIEDYARAQGRRRFDVVLHGGEPTLWPVDHFTPFFERVSEIREAGLDLQVTVQTNAFHLNWPLLDLLRAHKVPLGISLDGPRAYHDRFRVNHDGVGSYDRIMRNVQAMIDGGYGDLISGFLSVVQPEMPPRDYLEWAKTLPVKRLSVLWPIEYNYDNLPWQGMSFDSYARSPRYGEWFGELFRLWWEEDDPSLHIRHFFDVIGVFLGGHRHGDSIVNDELGMFVVNTDGCYEYPDYFRAYKDGGSRSPFCVQSDSIASLARDPIFAYCLDLQNHLPTDCVPCPHRAVCGGGFMPGRLSASMTAPFDKSVLCADQYHFFSVVRGLVEPSIAAWSASRSGLAIA